MTELNRIERMTQIIIDKHETPLASKIIWRQARAMKAIDEYEIEIVRRLNKKVVILPSIYTEAGLVYNDMKEIEFDSTLDAVEHFLRVLEEVKAKR